MPSRLASARSAYLRSAAHQPVQWFPWGPEAFERARAEGKPVLLDIGAVWCHWCHVMDGESYEHAALAEILNRDWISIKVDRDERPDVDARYQRAVQALTGQGGWPLTAFLTGDGDVFFGGTYFPPDQRHGRPAFADVLRQLSSIYREQPDRVAGRAGEIRQHLSEALAESQPGTLRLELLSQGADVMAQAFDFRHAGFGVQPKFPHPAACDFLLARWFDTGDRWPREIVDRTLTAMALGGIHDQVGGGFHRYAVDARWHVPHFEKMSYDNSELLRAYVHAAGAAGSPAAPAREGGTGPADPTAPPAPALYRRVVEGVAGWVGTVMSDPAGGYYASQDADVGLEDDGDYFTWAVDEVRSLVTADELVALERHFDIDEVGDVHGRPGRNVLYVKQSIPEIAAAMSRMDPEVEALLESGRRKLGAARAARPTPFVDRSLYTGWNAMMASAILEAAALLDRSDLEQHALRTLERIFREAADQDGAAGVRHVVGGAPGGLLDDQVHVAAACLDAFEATGGDGWRERARRLMEHVWSGYRAPDGGLTDVAAGRGGEGLLRHPVKPAQDAPTPAPNAVAAMTCTRLAAHTHDPQWRERAAFVLEAFAGGAAQLGVHGATLLRALDWQLNPPTHVVVVGDPADPSAAALHRVARATFRPRKVITRLDAGDSTDRFPPSVRAMADGAAPRAYVCTGPQCGPPAADPEALAGTLATFRVAA